MFKRCEQNGKIWFCSKNIAARHCFESAGGGLAESGFERDSVVIAKQIHSKRVMYVDKMPTELPECDGFVTDKRGIAVAIKTADCTPILLCDSEAGVVGALHGGWRGAAAGIAAEGVAVMAAHGAKIENIEVAIGPSARDCCYEVAADFVLAVSDMMGGENAEGFIYKRNGKMYADVVGINIFYLLSAGIASEKISVCGECTQCGYKSGLFLSFRESGGDKTPMLSIITPEF